MRSIEGWALHQYNFMKGGVESAHRTDHVPSSKYCEGDAGRPIRHKQLAPRNKTLQHTCGLIKTRSMKRTT